MADHPLARILLAFSVLPGALSPQAVDQNAMLAGLSDVSVRVDVVVGYDDPSLIGALPLGERLQEVVEREVRDAEITLDGDSESELVLAIAATPVYVGQDIAGVAVSSILQLKEPALMGRVIEESIEGVPHVGADSRAWRAAYWDLALDRGRWAMPSWSGPLGVAVFPVGSYEADLEREVVSIVRAFTEAQRRRNRN